MIMKIRYAEEKDLPALCEIEKACFRVPWSLELLRKDMVDNPLSVYIAAEDEDGETAGYMSMWKILDEGHINNVAVLPKHRRRHAGHEMMKFMLEVSACLGISRHTLEVRISNEAAIGLYESFGFRKAGIRKGYYEDNGEDALIMWRKNEG